MTLAIQQVEKARASFYAPAFNIVVSKKSLVHDLYLEVASVHAREKEKIIDHTG